MTEDDRPQFSQLLFQMDVVCKNIGTKKEVLSDETIDFYFEILKDIPFEVIKQNAVKYFRKNTGFFPSPAALREDKEEQEALAHQVWDKINKYLDRYYHPDIGNCAMKMIEDKMRKNGELHLYRYLIEWGPEILYGGAIAATRKHFIDAFKAEKVLEDKRQLEAKQPNALVGEITKKFKVE